MTIWVTLQRLPQWWKGLALGISVCCLIAAVVNAELIDRKLDNLHRSYGQTLANLAARRALEATVNKDRVSLQAIVQEIASNFFVINATIHDVENTLLAQAGPRGPTDANDSAMKIFTAPITIHNSIAGYIALTVDSSSMSPTRVIYGSFALLTLALLGIISLGLRRTAYAATPAQKNRMPIVEQSSVKSVAETADNTATKLPKRPEPQAEILLYFHNLRELHNQLNHSSLRSVTERLEIKLRDVMALYSGQLHSIQADYARITFADDTPSQATLNALCSAKLLLALNQQAGSIHLHFSCLVLHRDTAASQLKNLPFTLFNQDDWLAVLQQSAVGSLLVEAALLSNEKSLTEEKSLAEKLETSPCPDHDDLFAITAFNEPYNSLLNKQIRQLDKH